MPRLAIIDQIVSAGGGERFLQGLVEAFVKLPDGHDWEIHLLLRRHNSGGSVVRWPENLTRPNVHVRYLFDEGLGKLFYRLSRGGRILRIRGTARMQRIIPDVFKYYGPSSLRKFADARFWIEDYCKRQRFDAMYFSYPYLMECPVVSAPMVATPHDLNHKRHSSFGTLRSQIDREMPAWLHKSRRLVVSSDFTASELRHFYPDCAKKIRVVRPGIPGEDRLPSAELISRYAENAKLPPHFLLTPGWIIPHKNQKVVFEALSDLRRRGIDIPLVCVGPNSAELQPTHRGFRGAYLLEVLECAKRLDLKYGRDFFGLGYVSDLDLECLYRLATAVVMPTLYEAGSFPMREAIRARCPVICSRVAPIEEEVSLIGGNAWLFDPADHKDLARRIEEVFANTALAQQRTARAAELAAQVYSWKNMAAGYLSIFRELF